MTIAVDFIFHKIQPQLMAMALVTNQTQFQLSCFHILIIQAPLNLSIASHSIPHFLPIFSLGIHGHHAPHPPQKYNTGTHPKDSRAKREQHISYPLFLM